MYEGLDGDNFSVRNFVEHLQGAALLATLPPIEVGENLLYAPFLQLELLCGFSIRAKIKAR